jgi:hypothetical protein
VKRVARTDSVGVIVLKASVLADSALVLLQIVNVTLMFAGIAGLGGSRSLHACTIVVLTRIY